MTETPPTATTPVPAQSVQQLAVTQFHRTHGRAPHGVWSAPGRVNFIGEHTDYNNGFVLPFALPHRIAVAAAPRNDGVLTATTIAVSGTSQRAADQRIAQLSPRTISDWSAYPAGVAWALREHGLLAANFGADLVITGDVPAGAGLSSSHALECAVAFALLGLHGVDPDHGDHRSGAGLDRHDVIGLVQRSENEFVGAPTGILDQTASLLCINDHVLFFDVRSGERRQVRFALPETDHAVLVIDTRATHSHSESGYGERRCGCERAARRLGLDSLREIDDLDDAQAALPPELRPLVRHVVTENARVLRVVDALEGGRLDVVGELLTASHRSLRDDYRVSCPELDVAVDAALTAGALGARMTGGGFGGSAIALIEKKHTSEVVEAVNSAYARSGWSAARFFVAVPSSGAAHDSDIDLTLR